MGQAELAALGLDETPGEGQSDAVADGGVSPALKDGAFVDAPEPLITYRHDDPAGCGASADVYPAFSVKKCVFDQHFDRLNDRSGRTLWPSEGRIDVQLDSAAFRKGGATAVDRASKQGRNIERFTMGMGVTGQRQKPVDRGLQAIDVDEQIT